jgi:hypothetical protein
MSFFTETTTHRFSSKSNRDEEENDYGWITEEQVCETFSFKVVPSELQPLPCISNIQHDEISRSSTLSDQEENMMVNYY